MNAYVFIVSHPYHVLTVANDVPECKAGEFTLTDVPPGDYVIVIWKEGIAEKEQITDGKISAYNYGPDIFPTEIQVKVEAGKTFEIPDVLIDGEQKN